MRRLHLILIRNSLIIKLQHSKKCFLRHFHISDLAHSFLTFFLFFQQFTFTADITTITFGGNIFTHGEMFSLATTLAPMAAWMAIWNCWRGNKFFQFFAKLAAKILCTCRGGSSALKASTFSPFSRISIFTISASR